MITDFVHSAGPFDGVDQRCTRCGVLLVTTRQDVIGGVTSWPPPLPAGPIHVRFDDGVLAWVSSLENNELSAQTLEALCPLQQD